MATEHNFEIDQGGTWVKRLSWQDSNEQPYDLTGYTAKFTIRKNYSDIEKEIPPLLVVTDLDGIELTSTSNNITITLSADATASVPHGTCVYDLELIDGETVTKLLRGKAFVLPEVG